MGNRQLDTKRLYKLVKALVIAVTIINVVLAIYAIYISTNSKYVEDRTKYTFIAIKQCGSEWTSENDINNCFNTIMEPYSSTERMGNFSLLTAILLPSLFFGGTKLYKYVFPVKNNS